MIFLYFMMLMLCRCILFLGLRWWKFFGGILVKLLCLIYILCVNGMVWLLKFLFFGWLVKVRIFLWFLGRLVIISFSGLSMVMWCGVVVLRFLCM